MAEPFPFQAQVVGRGLVVVTGAVDLDTSPQLRLALQQALDNVDGPTGLVVDLSAVDFMDATGLGVLVGAANRAKRAGGDVRLRAPSPAVLRVLDVGGLKDAFPLVQR